MSMAKFSYLCTSSEEMSLVDSKEMKAFEQTLKAPHTALTSAIREETAAGGIKSSYSLSSNAYRERG